MIRNTYQRTNIGCNISLYQSVA